MKEGMWIFVLVAAGGVSCLPPADELLEPKAETEQKDEGRPSKECPDGAKLYGNPPPDGEGAECRLVTKLGMTVRHGPSKRWHSNGQLQQSAVYAMGKLHGPYGRWTEGGQRLVEGTYKDGNRHGAWKEWDAGGGVVADVRFEDGVQVREVTPKPTGDGPRMTYMWEVRRKRGGGPTLYILGTVHVGGYGAYPLDPSIEEAFARAGTMVVEADLGEQKEARSYAEFYAKAAVLPSSKPLRSVIGDEVWSELARVLTLNGKSPERFARLKPFAVLTVLDEMRIEALNLHDSYGMEAHFLRKAEGMKAIETLESLFERTKLLSELPLEVQAAALRAALAVDISKMRQDVKQLFSAWRRGDVEAVEALSSDETERSENLEKWNEAYLVERNRIMARSIERFLRKGKGTWFVMAGSFHFLGEQGLQKLLAKKGHAVRQVPAGGLDKLAETP